MGEKIKLIKDIDVGYLYVLKTYIEATGMTPTELEKLLVGTSYEFGELIRYDPNDIFIETLLVNRRVEDVKDRAMTESDLLSEHQCNGCENCTCKKEK